MRCIVFVPGFCGSNLFRRDEGGDRWVRLWLSQLDIAWNGIGHLDTDPEVSPIDPEKVRAGAPIPEVYQPFFEYFGRIPFPVFQFGYDFRADVATNGQRLANFLDLGAFDGDEVTLVGHSMGGLVVASCLNRLTNKAAGRLKQVITCATPWRGAFRTIELFAGHHDTVQAIVNLNRVFSRRNRLLWLREALRVISSWPGAYDLLPMPDLLDQYPPGPGQDFRTDGTIGTVNPWFSLAKYEDAVDGRPITVGAPDGANWYNLRGVGRNTSGPSPTVRDGKPDYWLHDLVGDGTVPEASSRPFPVFNAQDFTLDADHEQFMSDFDVCRRIALIVGAE